jgi:hypothetical protein
MKTLTNVIYPAVAVAVACFVLSARANANEPTPNHPKRRIDFTANPGQCAPERVKLQGELHLHFKKEGPVLVPSHANFIEFSGTGLSTGRRYVASQVNVDKEKQVDFKNGSGAGKFVLEFHVIGNPNPPGKPDPAPSTIYRFTVNYKVVYTFQNKVKTLNLGDPKVCCTRSGCLN